MTKLSLSEKKKTLSKSTHASTRIEIYWEFYSHNRSMLLARNPSILKISVGRRGQTARQASVRGTEARQPSSPREKDTVSFPFPTQTLLTWTSPDSPQELSCLLMVPPGLGLEAFTPKSRPPCDPGTAGLCAFPLQLSDKSVMAFLSPRDTCPVGG